MTAQQLKNSILQMAVQGKLVPQDPNDEPASVLLERIRAEKEQLIKEKKIKKEKNPSVIFRGADNLPYEKVGKNEPVCIADEVPFDIPDSWEWVRLSHIFSILNGDRGKNYPAKSTLSSTGIPFISAINLDGRTVVADDRLLCMTEAQYDKLGNGKLKKGDVVVCIRGSLGKHGRYPFDKGAIASSLVILRCHSCEEILAEYIMLWLDSPLFSSEIKKYDNGTAQPNLAAKSLEQFFVPLPPLNEQHRIIQQIDNLQPYLAEYNDAVTKITKLNETFPETLKKSILQWAVQGKLVPQDPSDEPAEILLERIRMEKQRLVKEGKIKKDKHESVIFRRDNSHYEKCDTKDIQIDDDLPFDLPSGWAWSRLRNLTSKIGAGSTPQGGRSVYVEKGVKFIRSQNVYDDGLRLGDIVYITEEINSKKLGSVVCPQDILLNITGGSIGRCAVVPEDFDIGNVNQHVMIIRLIKPDMRYWIHAVLTSPYIQNLIMDVQVGVSREGLSASKLMDFFIPVPPVNEQKRILTSVGKINKIINSAL